MRRSRALLALTVCLAGTTPPASAQTIASLPDGSVFDPGDRIEVLIENGCADARARVGYTLIDDARIWGAWHAADGCTVAPRSPSLQDLDADGHQEHEVAYASVEVDSATGSVVLEPLHLKRVEAEHGETLHGETSVVSAASDPFGGGQAISVGAGDPTVLHLGRRDLRGVSAIALRTASAADRFCGTQDQCRVGRALLLDGGPNGATLGVFELWPSTNERRWQRAVSEIARTHAVGEADLYLVVEPWLPACAATLPVLVTCASDDAPLIEINYLELIGSGAAADPVWEDDGGAWTSIFDGSSLDGWALSGCCPFQLESDGSMRSLGGFGLFYNTRHVLTDARVRLEFKVDSPDANSGVFVRFQDPGPYNPTGASETGYEIQVQDYGQAYPHSLDVSQTGAIYAASPGSRIASRSPGDWNQLEITMLGSSYTVTLNGHLVNEFTSTRTVSGLFGVQAHDPSGTVWYRDIRYEVLP